MLATSQQLAKLVKLAHKAILADARVTCKRRNAERNRDEIVIAELGVKPDHVIALIAEYHVDRVARSLSLHRAGIQAKQLAEHLNQVLRIEEKVTVGILHIDRRTDKAASDL